MTPLPGAWLCVCQLLNQGKAAIRLERRRLTDRDRYYGFTGYVDTLESLNFAYSELNKLGMLPPVQAKARPLI